MTICIKSLIKNRNLVIGCTNNCPYCYARNNCRRFHMTENFEVPQFFEQKLRMLDNPKPGTYLLTGMSDFSDWKEEWIEKTFRHIEANPQSVFLFLTKRPEEVHISTKLENVWMGVTVTNQADKYRLQELRKNTDCRHYHATFEPLHGPVGKLDLEGYDWIVVGTETGKRKGKVDAQQVWVEEIVSQAEEKNIPVFMKEEMAGIMGEDKMIQKMPGVFLHHG